MIKNLTRLFENDFQNIEEIINVKCEKYCDDIPLVIKSQIHFLINFIKENLIDRFYINSVEVLD